MEEMELMDMEESTVPGLSEVEQPLMGELSDTEVPRVGRRRSSARVARFGGFSYWDLIWNWDLTSFIELVVHRPHVSPPRCYFEKTIRNDEL